MADTKTTQKPDLEREYIIPLRRSWLRVPQYERTSKSIKVIKKFIAKHMKIPDRDVRKVRLDVYFNNEIWFRGRATPPVKIKVKAKKEGDIVKVGFVEVPQYVRFLQAKHEKILKNAEEKSEEEKKQEKKEEKLEAKSEIKKEKSEEDKTEEKEKEQSVAEQHVKEAKQQAKAQKHLVKPEKQKVHPQRMALQK